MNNWTSPKYNFIQHTIVLSGNQKVTRCIPLSKRGAKIRNQAGFFVFDKFRFFFFSLFKNIILQFFTMLQDKLHSFNQSRTIEARASFAPDHIIERFHEEKISIM